MLSGLVLAVGSPAAAYAEDTPPPSAAPSPSASAPVSPSPSPAAKPAAVKPEAVKPEAEQSAAVKPAAVEPAAVKPAAASCGGTLDFGTPVACDSITGTERHRYTITTTVPNERVIIQLYATSADDSLQGVLTGVDGTCFLGSYVGECTVESPGTHAIDVYLYYGSGSGSYALGVESRDNPSDCTTLDPATFTVDGERLSRSLVAGAAGDCYRFAGRAGMRLNIETSATSLVDGQAASLQGTMWNAAGDPVCAIQPGGSCSLTGDGVHTFVLSDDNGSPLDYTLRLVRTDRPTGCAPISQGAYGTLSDAQIGDVTLGSYAYTCFSVHLTAGAKTVRTSDGGQVSWELTDPDGTVCSEAGVYYGEACRVADGDYTLWLRNPEWTYEPYKFRTAVIDLTGDTGCRPATGTDWDDPIVSLTAALPIEMFCQPFTARGGQRVVAYTSGGGVNWITDGSGARICATDDSGQAGCVLPGSGPYRVIGEQDDLNGVGLQIRRLSDPAGCPVLTPGAYGTGPAGEYAGNRCRFLDVPAAGRYLVRSVDDANYEQWGEIYAADSTRVCDSGHFCDLPAAGRYTLVVGGSTGGTRNGPYATVFTAPAGSGCMPVSAQGLAGGAVRGSFTTVGETDCLEVDAPAGARIDVLTPPRASGTGRPDWTLIDAAGDDLCANGSSGGCVLTGEAPYRVLLNAPEDTVTGDYAVAVQRLDQITGCGTLPQGAFGNTVGVTTAFSATRFAACWTIPAGQHATSELVTFAPVAGTGAATLSVKDSTGAQVCGTAIYTSAQSLDCTFEAGKAYTVVMTASAASFQYRITRKDATIAGAACETPPNTVLGGPAITGTMTAPDDLRCYRVTAAAADNYWIGVRSTSYGARYWISDETGADRCTGYVVPCRVSGSTAYLVIVRPVVAGSVPYALDTWNLGTDGKPAAQCPAASAVPGFSLDGTLDATHTAVCVAVPVTAGSTYFGAVVTNTAGGDARPEPYLFTTGGTGDGLVTCALGGPGRYCSASLTYPARTGTALFVLAPKEASGTYPYRVRTSCPYQTCPALPYTLTSVAPASAPNSGPVTLTLRGGTLATGDTVRLTRTGSAAVTATVRNVDNGVLTADADLNGLAPGGWDVTVTSGADGRTATLTGGLTVTATPLKLVTAPAISGSVRVGSTIKVTAGSWSPAATGYTYQWTANGVTIKGATASAYAIPASLRGKRLAVTVTAKRTGRLNTPATSAGIVAGYGVAPKATKAPAISGTVKTGRKVKVTIGAWTPRPDAYRYQWLLNGKAIKGATGSSLTIQRAWAGKKLSVTVTAKKTGYFDGKKTTGSVTIKR